MPSMTLLCCSYEHSASNNLCETKQDLTNIYRASIVHTNSRMRMLVNAVCGRTTVFLDANSLVIQDNYE